MNYTMKIYKISICNANNVVMKTLINTLSCPFFPPRQQAIYWSIFFSFQQGKLAALFSQHDSFQFPPGLLFSLEAPVDYFYFLNLCTHVPEFYSFSLFVKHARILSFLLATFWSVFFTLPSLSHLRWKIIWGYINWFRHETSSRCCQLLVLWFRHADKLK